MKNPPIMFYFDMATSAGETLNPLNMLFDLLIILSNFNSINNL